jgi:two-component system, cell cycle response regulator DivK
MERQKRQVLVVDDNADMRALIGMLLEDEGYHPSYAADGPTAIEQACAHPPDLILMDISLPGMSGWETVERLREMADFRSTPIIAVTAHTSRQDQERSLAAGCNLHLNKPFDIDVFLQSVMQFVG